MLTNLQPSTCVAILQIGGKPTFWSREAAAHRRINQAAAARLQRQAFAIFGSILNSWTAQDAPPAPSELIHFMEKLFSKAHK